MKFENVGLISIIFAALLIVLLIVLIVISVLVLKQGKEPDAKPVRTGRRYEEEDDDEDEENLEDKASSEEPSVDDDPDDDSYIGADSAFSDSAFTDSAFSDSAFTDSAFSDSEISASAEETFDEEEDKNAPQEHTIELPDVSEEKAENTTENSEKDESKGKEQTVADSTFSDSAFSDSAFTDSAFSDSAFGPDAGYPKEESRPLPAASQTVPVNPVNIVNINTVNSVTPVNTTNPKAGIQDMSEMEDFLNENPVPKKPAKKKKVKKHEVEFVEKFGTLEPEFNGGDYFWYNTQDIAECRRKEDMYFYCHYFDEADECTMPLITEMYDCAFVKTEEIQFIAYGIEFKSMGFKEIMNSNTSIGVDLSGATHEPTAKDIEVIYQKWCGYVDKFMEIIVINAPSDIKTYIKDRLYEYGHNDVKTLLYSPE